MSQPNRDSLLASEIYSQKKKKPTEFAQLLRIFNILLSLAIIAFSIYSYIGNNYEKKPSFFDDPSLVVLPAYIALSGLIILAVECNIKIIVRNMKFLFHYLGRGIFNIYVGILCYALIRSGVSDTNKVIIYVAGGLMALFGVMYILAAIFCCANANRDYQQDDQSEKLRNKNKISLSDQY